MRQTTAPDQRSRRLRFALLSGGLTLTLFVGVGVYGLLRGPAPAPRTPASPAVTTEPQPGQSLAPRELPTSTGPERFVRSVAEGLFAWDTGLGYGAHEYMQAIVDVADREEAPGLAEDLRAYFPDDAAWGELRNYETRQWLIIDTITVPGTWPGVVANARPGTLPPGAAAYTITGTRHRVGSWEDRDVSDARPVSFTIFAACPTGDSCRLLRLSAADTPMP
ncbi:MULTISPECIES: hypothetical protein [Leucobacter]|uniref:Uncharacterized protein n=2 Tax=Leucobacter TaxID=55968 RepID=A0A4Q7U5B9_9MICO|nr:MULTISPECIES: hypothetical protein [Leucobacter]MBL3691109.1 hypothetical protein [Leucobacter chromiireducens subsp. chromiireducens]MBL3700814.1 hypothetical protein [Leucobacter luti]RZT68347.1 hypothetical protein EV139_0070 [Leucobacter luti]